MFTCTCTCTYSVMKNIDCQVETKRIRKVEIFFDVQ